MVVHCECSGVGGPGVWANLWDSKTPDLTCECVVPATLGTMAHDDSNQPPAPRLRASDKDRDAVLGVITDAVTSGRLDPDETAERQDEAISAKYLDELMPLIVDLPEGHDIYRSLQTQTGGGTTAGTSLAHSSGPAPLAPRAEPGSARPMNSVAIMSGRELDVPAGTSEVTTYALMGGDHVDLCEAMGPGVTVSLTSYSMMAGHDIYVPPGVRIRDDTINIMAGNEVRGSAKGDGSNGTLILKGVSFMAGHDIHLAKGYRAKDQGQLE
ncbi:protein of unknown function (DUF1707) [Brevibacterium antiquum CNRZ 918]|uniref:DUF1707 domain-containing protein n=2 Tax=Brevibacteriaceae TaxID=85019 RepID=A0A2H1KXK0_9MICO|nr:protein of unknown function (DUF1707) [Brevibacterium antiquum CNRZ 918]